MPSKRKILYKENYIFNLKFPPGNVLTKFLRNVERPIQVVHKEETPIRALNRPHSIKKNTATSKPVNNNNKYVDDYNQTLDKVVIYLNNKPRRNAVKIENNQQNVKLKTLRPTRNKYEPVVYPNINVVRANSDQNNAKPLRNHSNGVINHAASEYDSVYYTPKEMTRQAPFNQSTQYFYPNKQSSRSIPYNTTSMKRSSVPPYQNKAHGYNTLKYTNKTVGDESELIKSYMNILNDYISKHTTYLNK